MPETPKFDIQVVDLNDYALMLLVDKDGRASLSSVMPPDDVGDVLTRMTGHFHQTHDLTLTMPDALARALTAAGWVPPFDPADHKLSEHDWMELVDFAGKCENEGFGYAAEEYPPTFEDVALSAAIGHAPLDRLKALLSHHSKAVDAWWNRPDAPDLIDAHHAARA